MRRMMNEVSGTAVARVFHGWVNPPEAISVGIGVALDGKALASTVQDCHGAHQDDVRESALGVRGDRVSGVGCRVLGVGCWVFGVEGQWR
jgi:hypothetical protein